jgi:hypothetical protein
VLILQPIWANTDEQVGKIAEDYASMLVAEGYQRVRSTMRSMRPIASAAVLGTT